MSQTCSKVAQCGHLLLQQKHRQGLGLNPSSAIIYKVHAYVFLLPHIPGTCGFHLKYDQTAVMIP